MAIPGGGPVQVMELGVHIGEERVVHGADGDLHVSSGHLVRIQFKHWLDTVDESCTNCREQTGLRASGFRVQYQG